MTGSPPGELKRAVEPRVADQPPAGSDQKEISPVPEESPAEEPSRGFRFHVMSDLKSLRFRLWMFFVLSVHVAIDFLFIVGFALSQRYTEIVLDLLGEQPGMTEVKRQIIEYMFDGSTLTLLAVYTARDLYLTAVRIWRHL